MAEASKLIADSTEDSRGEEPLSRAKDLRVSLQVDKKHPVESMLFQRSRQTLDIAASIALHATRFFKERERSFFQSLSDDLLEGTRAIAMLLEASASRSATDLYCQDPQLAEVLQNVRACADLGGLDVEVLDASRRAEQELLVPLQKVFQEKFMEASVAEAVAAELKKTSATI